MSRSIGDRAGKEVGVISDPEIQNFLLLKSDKFLIIASDGVWDYITSQEAINIINKVYKKGKSELCCEVLLKEAVAKWENFSQSVDDITILVIFLRVKN
jgi:serine/threonine protein phosphatase PrpC